MLRAVPTSLENIYRGPWHGGKQLSPRTLDKHRHDENKESSSSKKSGSAHFGARESLSEQIELLAVCLLWGSTPLAYPLLFSGPKAPLCFVPYLFCRVLLVWLVRSWVRLQIRACDMYTTSNISLPLYDR